VDLRLSAEQEQLVASASALYARHASPEAVRKAEPGGHDPGLWARLVDLGVVPMAIGEAAGGWGALTLDLALLAEQHGRAVAPAPLVEAQVAARLLDRLGDEAVAQLVAGDRLITLALHPTVDGVARGVPAGDVADALVVLHGDQLLLVDLDDSRQAFENLGSSPLADVAVAGGRVLASGSDARHALEHAVDDWLRLTAAALVGLSARALEIGVDYVKERHAFGVAIGSFQAVAHPLADSAAAIDGARLLVQEAAWSDDEGSDRAPELAGLAFGFAGDTARAVTRHALHVHGGYGFMMEYDIQLYWRRARGWTNVWGEPAMAYRRAAARKLGS
jgi:alkylation response protein AidB-like acyl-CoA dehydrogenase